MRTVINQSRFVAHIASHDKPVPSSKPAPSHPNHGQRPYQERSIEIDSKGTEEEEKCV